MKLITTKGHGGIYRLLELYEIMPNYLSKAETKILFNRILLSQVSPALLLAFNVFNLFPV